MYYRSHFDSSFGPSRVFAPAYVVATEVGIILLLSFSFFLSFLLVTFLPEGVFLQF